MKQKPKTWGLAELVDAILLPLESYGESSAGSNPAAPTMPPGKAESKNQRCDLREKRGP